MKSNYFSSVFIFIIALFFSINTNADNEPNNDIANANAINLNSITNGSLSSSDIVDYYKITTTVDGRLSIDDNTSSNLGYYISLYDADGSTLVKSATRYESNSGTRIAVNLSPGNYYIKLNRTGYGNGTYNLNPSFNQISHSGDNESNDEIASANILNLNSQNSGNLGSRRDGIWDRTDYWKITIPEDGRLIIKDSTGSHLGYYIRIYDNDGTTLIRSATRYESESGISLGVNLSPGTYYLQLNRTGYDYTNYGTYTIFPDFKAVTYPGDIESNDIFSNANNLKLNKQNSGNLGSRRDGIWDINDYWKITIPEDGRLIIKDSTESHLGYYISIYDDDGTTLIKSATRYENNSGTILAVNLSPGTYYLQLHRTGYDYTTYGTYTIFPDFKAVTYPGDIESNDTFSNANNLKLNKQNSGNLGSRRDGIWDRTDYWKITILEDGRLIIKDSTESHLGYYISIYDDDGTTLIKSATRYDSNSGTRIGVNLSPGNYYLRLHRTGYDYTNYGTYTIVPDFTPTTYSGDYEPNDSLDIAGNLVLNNQNTGNLGSRRNGIWDVDDYWKITIPEDGRLIIKDSTESHLGYYISIYDDDGTTLIKSATRYDSNSGTRIGVNLSPGNYYLRLHRTGYDYTNYGTYTIVPDFTPTTYSGDYEPNDSLEIAVNLVLNTKNTGNLGSRRDGLWDKKDFWKFTIPEDGRLIIKDSTESSLSYYIRLYRSNDNTLIRSYTRYDSNGGSRINENLSAGNYYLVLERGGYNYSTYGSYTIFPEYTKAPKANFEIFQDIKTVSFNNKTIDGESFLWDFDDGSTSELENPSHSYSDPGEYLVSLIATNLAGEDTATKKVIIYGIKGVSPQIIGNNGIVTITILGGGFSDESIIQIRNGGSSISATSIKHFERGAIEATFNLNNIGIGTWDIAVTNTGKPEILKENALTVVEANEPEPWVNISGRSKALFNRWQTYTLEYGNTANVDADYVPVFLTMSNPNENQLEFIDLDIVYPDYVIDNDLTEKFDSINYYFDIDTLYGEYNPTRVFALIIPKIPAGYSGNVQFRVKTTNSLSLNIWNNAPLMLNNQIAKNLCKTQGSNLGDCIEAAKVKAIRTMLPAFVDLLIPGAGCVGAVANEFISIRESRMNDYLKRRTWGAFTYDMAGLFLNCVGSFTKIGPIYNLAISTVGTLQLLHDGVYQADNDCRDQFGHKSEKNKNIKGVSSFDPNEIVGPSGYADANFISPTSIATYTIFFENKNTATAPAQEIWIIDTLNINKFNLDIFSFGTMNIGDTTIVLLPGQSEFSIDIDFRPKQQLVGRVSGTLDKEKGIVKVYYNSLDPLTMSDNENPDLGILPPNNLSPEGEGSISFSVGLNPIISGDSFSNNATIIFDYNSPIKTNTWVNTIDNVLPKSNIESYNFDDESNIITLNINGSDNLSGVKQYTIYISKDEGDYMPTLITKTNSVTFKVENNIIYKFYSIATDNIGNIEQSPGEEDINFEVLGYTDIYKYSMYNIYPNPVRETLYIDSKMKGDCFIEIIDINGKTIITKLMKTISGEINLSSLSRGIYYVRITNDEYSISSTIIVK